LLGDTYPTKRLLKTSLVSAEANAYTLPVFFKCVKASLSVRVIRKVHALERIFAKLDSYSAHIDDHISTRSLII
jgi:hypothetical protein